jgi:hypothetical protein
MNAPTIDDVRTYLLQLSEMFRHWLLSYSYYVGMYFIKEKMFSS